jgi:hypothetical protein
VVYALRVSRIPFSSTDLAAPCPSASRLVMKGRRRLLDELQICRSVMRRTQCYVAMDVKGYPDALVLFRET